VALSLGIVGMPNVGKSTLFTALTRKAADAANYPFATIEPTVGLVPVPDSRLDALAQIVSPERIMPEHILPLPPKWERDLDYGWVVFKSGNDEFGNDAKA